jgi:hypothetical protein
LDIDKDRKCMSTNVAFGSFSTELAGFASRAISASPRKRTFDDAVRSEISDAQTAGSDQQTADHRALAWTAASSSAQAPAALGHAR